MNEMVTDDRRQGLVLPGPGRWGLHDADAYERVEQRQRTSQETGSQPD